jgi:hypothetical protein
MIKTSGLLACVLVVGSAWAGASGRVVGPDGAPISGADICEYIEGSPEHCVRSDAQGFYRMDNALRSTLLVRATGFVSKQVDAAPLSAPVELRRAGALLVTVVDADTGAPLSSGKVMIDSPTGRRIGDFVPFNKAGVRISTLDPGTVFVRAESRGYEPSGPVPVDLVSGEERTVNVPLKKSRKASHRPG